MVVAVFFCTSPALAQEDDEVPSEVPVTRKAADDKAIFNVSLENDYFSGEDNGYTNGVRFSYLSPENHTPRIVENLAASIPFFAHSGHRRWQFEVGQNMYTPSNISTRAPQPNDRPYAGWLYSSVGILNDTGKRLDNLQLTLGMVGPASGAAETQDFIHKLTDSPDPRGWRYQLQNELGVVLTYERKWRSMYEFSPGGWAVDITPSMGGSVGNVYTNATVGGVVRLGLDLPADYGPPLIRPSLPGSDFFIPSAEVGWYLFAGVEGRAVARNIFLDGNTFRNSHSVDKENLVGGLQAGIAFTYDDMRIAYTQVLRTKEFKQQVNNESYGAVTVSWRF